MITANCEIKFDFVWPAFINVILACSRLYIRLITEQGAKSFKVLQLRIIL
jgi:hypothetical protein